jgi:hypothetical protein
MDLGPLLMDWYSKIRCSTDAIAIGRSVSSTNLITPLYGLAATVAILFHSSPPLYTQRSNPYIDATQMNPPPLAANTGSQVQGVCPLRTMSSVGDNPGSVLCGLVMAVIYFAMLILIIGKCESCQGSGAGGTSTSRMERNPAQGERTRQSEETGSPIQNGCRADNVECPLQTLRLLQG